MLRLLPGIVNRTFENRTQSNSIRGLSSIEFGNRTKSNTTLSVRDQFSFLGNRARYEFIELDMSDQFSFLGNRARYEFIELDMSTVLALSIPSSRPLTFPGGKSKNSYRAR